MNVVNWPSAIYALLLVPAVLRMTSASVSPEAGHQPWQGSSATDTSSLMVTNASARPIGLRQQPVAQDTSKVRPKPKPKGKPKPKAAADSSKAKPKEVPPRVPGRPITRPPASDTTKKPS